MSRASETLRLLALKRDKQRRHEAHVLAVNSWLDGVVDAFEHGVTSCNTARPENDRVYPDYTHKPLQTNYGMKGWAQ